MGNSELLFETIIKQNLSDRDTKDFLTELVNAHPYFTAAQFYLLQQTDPNSIDYTKIAAITSILFNNPFWLDFQLNQSIIPAVKEEQNIIIKEEIDTTVYDSEIESLEKIHPVLEKDNAGLEKIAAIKSPENVVENEPIIESIIDPLTDYLTTGPVQQADLNIEKNYTEQQYLEDEEEPGNELLMEEKEIEPMNIKLNFTTATTTTEDTISFEPLHTSDYFASVGIKFSEEVKPGDKLGKQLKSFTDWLKTMKKIHTDQLPPQSEQSVIIIQKMAEKSNAEGEVLTEAMAEVLLQQGKSNKAMDVYKKLSLLNPSKSAYFAAKIDQIQK